MSLNRRDLLKALGAAPLCGMLGVAPDEEKILRKVDPEFVETIERPQLGKGHWKIEGDVFIQSVSISAYAMDEAMASYEIGPVINGPLRLCTHDIADSVQLYNRLCGGYCHMTLTGRVPC